MESHDLIVTYKETENQDLPLILVIGREPNEDAPFSNTTGTYDFDDAPKCAFWNQSYGVVGKITGSHGIAIKALSRKVGASPIAFTDASPIPIGNHNPNKHQIKESITESAIDIHVENILAMSHILNRVRLVILTGHDTRSLPADAKRVFEYSSSKLVEGLDGMGTRHISVPFMYGTNQPAILERFRHDETSAEIVKQVVNEFETLPPVDGHKAA